MRRLFAWLAGAAGGLAAYRAVTRRRDEAPVSDTRADELRAKLAETREQPVAEPEPVDPDKRRAHVHEQARATIDEMRGE
jgi:hypothetical protein